MLPLLTTISRGGGGGGRFVSARVCPSRVSISFCLVLVVLSSWSWTVHSGWFIVDGCSCGLLSIDALCDPPTRDIPHLRPDASTTTRIQQRQRAVQLVSAAPRPLSPAQNIPPPHSHHRQPNNAPVPPPGPPPVHQHVLARHPPGPPACAYHHRPVRALSPTRPQLQVHRQQGLGFPAGTQTRHRRQAARAGVGVERPREARAA